MFDNNSISDQELVNLYAAMRTGAALDEVLLALGNASKQQQDEFWHWIATDQQFNTTLEQVQETQAQYSLPEILVPAFDPTLPPMTELQLASLYAAYVEHYDEMTSVDIQEAFDYGNPTDEQRVRWDLSLQQGRETILPLE